VGLTAREISVEELPEIRAALNEARLPPAELTPDVAYYRFVSEDGRTAGFGGIEGRRADRLLRSVVALPEFRGTGLGAAIVGALERFAAQAGTERLHLLTTTAAPFFEKLGWEARDRMTAPVGIAVTTEFATLCPKTARYMVKAVGITR